MKLIFQYSPWLILLCLLAGLLYAFLLYRRDKRLVEFPLGLIRLLAILRFVSATFLAILLLSPLVKYMSRQIAEPILIVAHDNSESMVLSKDSTRLKNEISDAVEKLKNELKGDFQIEHYFFGEELRKANQKADHSDRYSNFEELFKEVQNRFENRNVGAMLLISDGIYNRGMNPIYSVDQSNYPIYTLAVGDTNQRKDLIISNIISNKIAFLGNQFPIQLDYQSIKFKGSSTKIKLKHKGKLIEEKEVEITENMQFGSFNFLVQADEIGLQTYQLSISPLEEESSLDNNFQNIYIDVLDSRQKILLAYQSPHPDISAIQRAISSVENYKVEIKQIDQITGDIESYDLLIVHGLTSVNSTQSEKLIKDAISKEVSILYFLGQSTNWTVLNSLETAISAANPIASLNEVYPLYNPAFPLFKLNEEQLNAIKAYPPIKVPQANYILASQVYVLLKQQIGSVPTNAPLLAFIQKEKRKEGVFVGEGLWRWRLDNYSRFGDYKVFDQLITKMVQYLSVKADKSYFRISHEKEILENEKLRFDLQLFNKAYDPINDPDAFMVIKDEAGNEFDYQFNKTSDAYFLELSGLNIGNYTYKASTKYDQQNLEERGRFSIKEIKVESVQLLADHNLLYQLANKSGGKILYELDVDAFKEELTNRDDISSLSYTSEDVEDIINLRWIFFVLLFLLTLEWFIRKYWGAY